ncbi:hypothetical protein [Kutzneria buriramensis]|uniref:Uncharacterized protein n=1 Tax=Kutzneria buriramensis TaxID=1045776 RepID=A0A3E0GX11_9PSEU|nr:hypothetical protein [Kutzneria buriramensis]REH29651.1 hypothetical protein BCF44_12478 [Kutzneria buriramensis]
MRSSVATGTAAVLAALGLGLVAPAVASAAPAGGGAQLCVANHNGAQIDIGHFIASGHGDDVEAVGRVSAGTEGINLGV